MAAVAFAVVPAHWTSIWNDVEFTGWVVPISNRLASGLRLYADGGHSPMPPIPFLLVHGLSGGHGIWILESALNFLFQAGTLLLVYRAIASRCSPRIAFWATLGSIPVFFALQKTIVYDSMAQFLTAATAIAALRCQERLDRNFAASDPEASRRLPIRPFLLPGALTALVLLTKQSTGVGVFVGVVLTLLIAPSYTRARMRLQGLLMFGAATIGMLLLVTGMMAVTRLVDGAGLIRDVFLNGAEPKGGRRVLLELLRSYGMQTMRELLPWGGLAALILWAGAGSGPGAASEPGRFEGQRAASAMWIPLSAALGLGLLLWADFHGAKAVRTPLAALRGVVWEAYPRNSPILWTGFFAAVGQAILWTFRPRIGRDFGGGGGGSMP